jgi:hypothetical protein
VGSRGVRGALPRGTEPSGLGNEIPARPRTPRKGSIQVAERLGGLLKYYHRAAA